MAQTQPRLAPPCGPCGTLQTWPMAWPMAWLQALLGCALAALVLLAQPPSAAAGFACLSSPCVYGICMDDLNSSFTCYCIDGYTGGLCQTNWDECWSSPCLNGGSCVDGVASFNCTCADGFVGDLCEQDVNECFSNPCLNNGTCLDGPNGYACMCMPGYSGERCELDVAVCNATAEARCSNGGICQEGPGMAFSCTCPPGWTGMLCDEPVNECESSPCQHGGVCVDLHAGYACACLFGYTGRHCEQELEPCARNPCLNGALCLLEDGEDVCYCVPDYHGDRCQLQYDECRRGPGCRNGGTCIDGVDEFSCSCPPGLSGGRCECVVQHGGHLNCSDAARPPRPPAARPTTTRPPPRPATTLTSLITARTSTTTPAARATSPAPTKAPTTPRTAILTTAPGTADTTMVAITTPSSTSSWTAGVIANVSTTSPSSPIASTTSSRPQTTTAVIPGGTRQPGTRPTTGLVTSLLTTTKKTTVTSALTTTAAHDLSGTAATTPTARTETTVGSGWSLSPGVNVTVDASAPPFGPTAGPVASTTWATSVVTGDVELTPWAGAPSEWPTTATESSFTFSWSETTETTAGQTSAATGPTVWDEAGVSSTDGALGEGGPGPRGTSSPGQLEGGAGGTPSPTSSGPSGTTSFGHSANTAGAEATTVSAMAATRDSKAFPVGASMTPHDQRGGATTQPTTLDRGTATEGQPTTGAGATSPHALATTATPGPGGLSTDFLWTTTAPTVPAGTAPGTSVAVATAPDEATSPASASSDGDEGGPGSTTSEPAAEANATDCSEAPCLNGASCEDTTNGVRCVCAFGWSGPRCASEVHIASAAFAGHSFLVHRLAGGRGGLLGAKVAVRARTLAPSGLLLHAVLAEELYMTLYLDDGLLKFQFSCGVQTMVFSEVQHRVNNGFDLHIAASLEVLPLRGAMRPCAATLHVNHSLAMSGEQQSVEPPGLPPGLGGSGRNQSAAVPGRAALLYLGGLPGPGHALHPDQHDDLPLPGGLVGCMLGLEVDDETRRVFADAAAGIEVSECAALACLSAPCQSGGSCVQDGQGWNCLCPSGYVGRTCEISVCRNNPCKFGGTCVPFPASGFLCLCPLGKHGLFCESDLEIAQPAFSPSVGGLSSFAAYSLPVSVEDAMELRFRFTPTTQDQVGLMFFLGQDGPHDATSDHLAVSFIKGYVVLTWNLGSGPRRIFTPRPLEPRGRRPHSVRLGRSGASAWLVADGMANVTGTSPGPLSQLNTAPWLYLGGHDAANFSGLPHDLPLHSGFAGCLLDVEVLAGPARPGRVAVALERTRAAAGRAVGQCGTTLCHARACQHRAACIHHAATYACLCPDGWFGPVCAQRFNPCDSTRHNCSEGSTCVPLKDGYECDCPFGRTGRHCEREEAVTDVLLSGRRSFLSLGGVDLQRAQSCVGLDVRPLSDDGLLLLAGHAAPRAPGLALALRGGLLEARLSSGTPARRWAVVTVRSRRALAREDWHRVRVCRYGRRLFLWVDGAAHSAALRPTHRLPAAGAPLYIGGAPDLSALPSLLGGGHLAVPLRGCVRGLSVNWRHTPLDGAHVLDGRNVADCDGTACGGDVCQHGGSCWLGDADGTAAARAYCTCTRGYTGPRCEHQMACDASDAAAGLALPCRNRGRCEGARCHCPAGWGGAFCEEEVTLGTPHFGGEGYLVVDPDAESPRRGRRPGQGSGPVHPDVEEFAVRAGRMRERRDISFLYLNFSTTQDHGMILWSAQDDEVVGVGVEAGRLKVAWGWRGAGLFVALMPGPAVSDGAWHDLALSFGPNVTLWTDASPDPVQRPAAVARPVATGAVFFVGGFPGNRSVVMETKGIFNVPFNGCLQQVSWNQDSSVTDFTGFQGENVGTCELFEP